MKSAKTVSFSVVMCNLNEIKLIEQSLKSLKNQTLRPKEIIVVDAGSTDGSLEVARALADNVYGPVKGIGAQRLYGILASKGDCICCANSDTLYPRNYLENASRHLLNPEVKAVTGPCRPIPETRFNLIGGAQGAFSFVLYLMLPTIYEHNLCFKKEAFIKSKLRLSEYWMRSLISSPHADIGYFMRYALKPRWEKDMLVYTRLPTRNASTRIVLKYLLRYGKEHSLIKRVRWISKTRLKTEKLDTC